MHFLSQVTYVYALMCIIYYSKLRLLRLFVSISRYLRRRKKLGQRQNFQENEQNRSFIWRSEHPTRTKLRSGSQSPDRVQLAPCFKQTFKFPEANPDCRPGPCRFQPGPCQQARTMLLTSFKFSKIQRQTRTKLGSVPQSPDRAKVNQSPLFRADPDRARGPGPCWTRECLVLFAILMIKDGFWAIGWVFLCYF